VKSVEAPANLVGLIMEKNKISAMSVASSLNLFAIRIT
jgi:hypothetical protein